MRGLPRLPSLRRSVPLLLAVFVAGLGVGAVLIAISGNPTVRRIVVTDTVVSVRAQTVTPTVSATSSVQPSSTQVRPTAKPKPADRSIEAPDATASFARLQAQLGGSVGLAVSPLGSGPITTFGPVQIAHAWSTSKVPVLVTLLYSYERTGQMLSPQGRQEATLALTESDNAAIEALFGALEQLKGGLIPASEAVQQKFREAGDDTAIVNTAPNDQGFTTYGQSEWTLRDEILFYRALARGCLLDPADTAYVLGLMQDVIPSQRWGAGSASYPGAVTLEFKGGWGPENGDYQVRQTAIVRSGNRGYVMTMIALPASGAFVDGTNMLTDLATWARQHFNLAPEPAIGCATGP